MSKEYKLSYTGSEIDKKLKLVDDLSIFVTPQMFGARGDGLTDDTASIQAALNASSYVYIPDGTYLIDATHGGFGHKGEGGIFPQSNQTIILSNNAILKPKENLNGFYNVINICNVENVIIKGGKVEGIKTTPTESNYGGEFGHGINILASNNILVDSIEIYNFWGDSLCIGYYGSTNSNNIKIINCILHDSRRQGISIVGGTNIIIKDCDIYNIGGTAPESAIDIEPDGDYGIAENILIEGCHCHDNATYSVIVAGVDISVNNIENIKILNCTLNGYMPILNGKDILVSGCTLTSLCCSAPLTLVQNCIIGRYLIISPYKYGNGNAIFNDCIFNCVDTTVKGLVRWDIGYYTDYCFEDLIFNNCIFELQTLDEGTNFLLYGPNSVTPLNKTSPLIKRLEFNNSKITLNNTCYFSNTLPVGELDIKNSTIIFSKGTSYQGIECNSPSSSLAQKFIFTNSKMVADSHIQYLFNFSNRAADYDITICNNIFPTYTNFILNSSQGTTGGIIRFYDNNSTKNNIAYSHSFTFEPKPLTTIDQKQIVDTVLAALPTYAGEVV